MAGRQPGLVGRTRPRPSRPRKRPTRLRAAEGGDCSAAPLRVVLQEAGDIGSLHPLQGPTTLSQAFRASDCPPASSMPPSRPSSTSTASDARSGARVPRAATPVRPSHNSRDLAVPLLYCSPARPASPEAFGASKDPKASTDRFRKSATSTFRRCPRGPRLRHRNPWPPEPSPASRRPLTASASTRSRHPEAAQAGPPWLRHPGSACPARPSCHGRSGSCSTARPGPPR